MREIPLTQGLVALVDDEDYEDLDRFKWTAHRSRNTFYAVRSAPGKKGRRRLLRMHQYLTGWDCTDHENGNGLDNRRENLRPATAQQNSQNRQSWGASNYLGVSRHRSGKWVARIQVDGKYKHLGLFLAEETAARAYDDAARERDPEFCRLNFPEG